MKKSIIFLGLLATGFASAQVGQVGVNTDSPKATMDINPNTANAAASATTNEGILIPRLSKARLNNIAKANLTESTLVYVDDYSGASTAVTSNVTSKGFYYYNTLSNHSYMTNQYKWVKLTDTPHDLRLVGTNHITQDAGVGGNGTSGGDLYANNIAIGTNSMRNAGMGELNIGIGMHTLYSNNISSYNIAIGYNALFSHIGIEGKESAHNIAIGNAALSSDKTGVNNVAVGGNALSSNISGRDNVAVGGSAMLDSTTGSNNVALGTNAMRRSTSGNNNIAIGESAVYSNASGNNNIGIGVGAMRTSTGSNNIAMGTNAMRNSTTGDNNIVLGYQSLYTNTTGTDNIGTGINSLFKNTTGRYNIAQGTNSLYNNLSGHRNIALGHESGSWIKGHGNIHIGSSYISDVSTELNSVIAIGNGINTNLNKTTGRDNSILLGHDQTNSPFIGMGTYQPVEKLTVNGNITVGFPSGATTYPQIGNYLSFEGTQSLDGASPAAGQFPNSDPLVFYRYDVARDESNLRLVIGDNEGSNDAFTIGTRNNTTTNRGYVRGSISPISNLFTEKFRFNAAGKAFKLGGGTWDVLSDVRLKENIKPYQKGLKEIMQINPVNFNYKKEANKGTATYTGVIAQEIEKVVPSMVGTTKQNLNGKEQEYKYVDGNEYTFMLINAIKEQQKQIEELKKQNQALNTRLENLEKNKK